MNFTVTGFIDSLQGNAGLWTDSKKKVTFCSWADQYINTPYFQKQLSVAQRLGRCLPSNSPTGTDLTGPTATQMYMLEALAVNFMSYIVCHKLNPRL